VRAGPKRPGPGVRGRRGARARRDRLVGQPRRAPMRRGTGGMEGCLLSLGLGRARRSRSAAPPRAALRTDRGRIRPGVPRGRPPGRIRRAIMRELAAAEPDSRRRRDRVGLAPATGWESSVLPGGGRDLIPWLIRRAWARMAQDHPAPAQPESHSDKPSHDHPDNDRDHDRQRCLPSRHLAWPFEWQGTLADSAAIHIIRLRTTTMTTGFHFITPTPLPCFGRTGDWAV